VSGGHLSAEGPSWQAALHAHIPHDIEGREHTSAAWPSAAGRVARLRTTPLAMQRGVRCTCATRAGAFSPGAKHAKPERYSQDQQAACMQTAQLQLRFDVVKYGGKGSKGYYSAG
jgi:hypothetical protein